MSSFFKGLLAALFALFLITATPIEILGGADSDSSISLVSEAQAQDASPIASPEASPAAKSAGEKIGGTLTDIADKIPLSGPVIMVLVFLYDFARRKWPTKNPASLVRDVKAVIGGIKKLLDKLDQLLDAVFGQSTK